MGNMSNPSINRWGLNIFWYNFWFTDSHCAKALNQDALFSKLLHIYLFYGINLTYNLFANKYWYASNYYKLSVASYMRLITRKGAQFGELVQYSLRKEADCVFPMKLWILKYSHWIVINQYWFHPLKKSKKIRTLGDSLSQDSFHITKHSKLVNLRKLKTLLSFNFLKSTLYMNYYKF